MRAPCPPVAVVGVSGIFPGSRTIAGFWRDIVEGRDLFTDVPSTHWLVEDYLDPDPTVPDKIYTARGAFLPSIDIDPVEFGIPPALFPSTDTCQLLALLAARDVLNDVTGHDLSKLKRERIAVILGVTAGQKLYVEMSNRLQRPVWVKGLRESGLPESEVQAICDRIAACYLPWTESTFPGSLGNVVAGRICNRFDLGGANCVTDAACASTLAAMSLALSQLYLGQADMVITGGADTFNDPSMYMCFSKTPALSAKGRCRPFDASADGTLLGEGVGFFALKRLDDAEREGDHIYAVIHALEGASDGRALSVYAPLAQGQARAVRRTYESAGISPATVELVEAHGTGTRAGDAAEFAGLKMVFEEAGRAEPQWCAIGSIKSQIGHLKAAAGAASMFKAVMSLNEGVLPPTIGVDTPNPKLDIPGSPFYLNTEARPWVRDAAHPRRAAVSSFGFGGSNWHMLLEEYRGSGTKADRFRASPTELVLLGADTPETLAAQCRDLAAECTPAITLRWLARRSQLAWKNSAHTARLSIVATSESDLAARLNQAADAIAGAPKTAFTLPGGVSYTWQATPGKVAFLFPGQGSQYAGMTADLSMAFEAARSVWDAADDTHIGDIKLHEVVFPKPVFTDDEKDAQAALLKATEWTQPAVGAASLACRAVLHLVGLDADMMAGHSFGEISALAAAGTLADADVLRIARRRGELMAEASGSGGAMLALTASRKEVEQLLTTWALPLLVVANDNAPQQVVLSGSVESIDEAQRRASAAGLGATRLPVAAAFHSPLIEQATAPFAEALASASFATPRVPVYANATAQPYAGDAAAVRNQLGEQMRSAVRFVETLDAMYEAGARTFIEVGPSAVLTGLAQQCLAGRAASVIAMDRKDAHGLTSLWQALGQLAVAGVPLAFDRLWERVAVAAPITKKPAMTMTITGANYGKVYPPANGAAGLPKPNPERTAPAPSVTRLPAAAAASPVHAPIAATPVAAVAPTSLAAASSSPARTQAAVAPRATPIQASSDGARLLTDAHEAFQRTLGESQAQYLRAMESAFANYCAAQSGSPIVASTRDDLKAVAYVAPSATTGAMAPPAPRQSVNAAPDMRVAPTAPVAPIAATAKMAPPAPRLVSCVPEPVAPAAKAPAASAAPKSAAVPVASLLLDVVSEKTGYPVAMLSLDMALEADLGIDSIKRVEILSTMQQRVPDLPAVDATAMAALKTLGQIVAAMGATATTAAGVSGDGLQAVQAGAAPAGTGVPVLPDTADAAARLIEIVAEKTGYPATMLSLDMALEADLGIDSIKRVEILSALQQRVPGLPPVDATAMASLKTLGQIITAMGGSTAATPATVAADGLQAVPVASAAAGNGVQAAPSGVTETVDAAARLLEIVSEKTGYPAAMLSLDMALEADLGIDSIKRVEILAAMQKRCPDLPPVDATAMAALKTLGQIVTAMNGSAAAGDTSKTVTGNASANRPAAAAASSTPDVSAASTPLDRFRVVEVAAPPIATRRAIAGPLVVTPDGRGISTELVAVLRKRGVDAIEVTDVPATARGVVYLGGLRRMDDIEAALAVNEEAFRAAQTAAAAIENGGLFVTVQDTGGNFGLDGHDPIRAWSAGLAGLARTAALEWPLAKAKAIDLECNGRSIRQLALVLADELQSASPAVDVGLHADGLRTTLEAVPSPLVAGDSSITPQSVLLVSGGARGVTASAIVALARASRPSLALLGRTPLVDEPVATAGATTDAEIKQALLAAAQSSGTKVTPQELGARTLEILAVREIRATLRVIEEAGARVRYYAADVLDVSALTAVLDDVRASFGPVTGLIHGAGVLADKKIADKTVAQFRRVFETKVLGLRALLDATESDPLDTIVLFSSVAARTGNFGQCDYAMANEILNKVAAAESRTRGTCRVRAIGWGPWAGGMVTPALEKHFRDRGVPVIQRPQGVRHFVAELSHATPSECEVVVGGMLVGVASV